LGIAHLDIKPHNLVYDKKSKQIYIIDFDHATIRETSTSLVHGLRGTPVFAAPEVSENCEYDPFFADLYSVGMTINFLARVHSF